MFRTFDRFMQEEFSVPLDVSITLISNALAAILEQPLLHTEHDPKSPVLPKSDQYSTGFNWEERYRPNDRDC